MSKLQILAVSEVPQIFCRNECRSSWYSLRPLVGTNLQFFGEVGFNFALKYSILRVWGHSSAGRALAWHARGRRFDPAWLHQISVDSMPGLRPHRLEAEDTSLSRM